MHFNSMMAQTRRIAVVVALALYAAATSDTFNDTAIVQLRSFELSFSTLAVAGILFSAFALFADRSYYHRLLMASVRFAERLEDDCPKGLGLSTALSNEVSQGHAHLMAFSLYGGLIIIGLIILVF